MDNNTNNWKEFTLGNPQEEQPRRVAKRSKRKPLLALLIVAVLAIGAVTAAVLLDRSGFDGLRRSIIYAKAVKDENGCAQLYRYSSDQSGRFASLEGSLVSVSMHQIAVLDEKNRAVYDEAVDPVEMGRTYTETSEKIPDTELTAEEVLNIITGVAQ